MIVTVSASWKEVQLRKAQMYFLIFLRCIDIVIAIKISLLRF